MSTLENVRAEWAEGSRRLAEEARDRARAGALHAQLETVTGELRRRVGSTFTLAELARAHADAERWARTVIEERAPSPGWPRSLTLVVDAAFHAYSRGAVDYVP